MKPGIPRTAFAALALVAVSAPATAAPCDRYATEGVRPGMEVREVWSALGGRGDATGSADAPAGAVAVVRYTSRSPAVEVEYDRDDIGKNRGTATAVRSEIAGGWARDLAWLVERFGEPDSGGERIAGGLVDGPVEWVDPGCRVRVRAWYEPAAWWEPGNARYWLEVRRYEPPEPERGTPASAPASVPAAAAAEPESGAAPATATPTSGEGGEPGPDGVTPPVRIASSYVAPVYPRIAFLAGLEGQVRADVRIGTSGEVLEIVGVEAFPEGRGFEKAATDAIRQWRYMPAVRDGEPVEVVIPVTVDFKARR